jgi:hypothetical protein
LNVTRPRSRAATYLANRNAAVGVCDTASTPTATLAVADSSSFTGTCSRSVSPLRRWYSITTARVSLPKIPVQGNLIK